MGTIGHVEHGKTTLTAAITKVIPFFYIDESFLIGRTSFVFFFKLRYGFYLLFRFLLKREKLKLLPLMKLIKLSKPMFLLQSDSDGQSMLRFDLGMILIATDEFSAGNKLGQGGFGSVYKV